METCPEKGDWNQCPECDGKGFIIKISKNGFGRFEKVKCSRCEGSGLIRRRLW